MPRKLLLLGHGLQLETNAHRLTIIWNVACGTPTTQSGPALVDIEKCGPFDGPFDIYVNESARTF